jgi:hypothetical protein
MGFGKDANFIMRRSRCWFALHCDCAPERRSVEANPNVILRARSKQGLLTTEYLLLIPGK